VFFSFHCSYIFRLCLITYFKALSNIYGYAQVQYSPFLYTLDETNSHMLYLSLALPLSYLKIYQKLYVIYS